jgi:hypothetical protein
MAVQEQIYRSSGQAPAAAPLPGVSAEALGAGIGQAIEGAGAQLEASSMRAMQARKEREQDAANAQASVDAAQLSTDLSAMAADQREAAPLDGSGHVAVVTGDADERIAKFLQAISNPKVREHWRGRVAEMRGNLIDNEDGWARGRRVEAIGTNARTSSDLWDNQLQTNPDPGLFDEALKAGDTFWSGVNVPADVREKGLREWHSGKAENYSHGLNEKDPVAGLAVLQSGALDSWLEPAAKKVLVNEAQTNIRIASADARRQQDQAKSQLREDVTEFKQRIDRGELPADKEAAALVGRAQQLGLGELVDDIQYGEGKAKLSRVTDKWTSADWEHNVNSLATKVAGGKASADEQIELRVLQELRPAKEQRFRNDPEGFAAGSGIAVPQVDIANPDPAAVAQKKSWARSFASTARLGEPPYLNKDQLETYGQRANQGPVGQLEVASELRDVWGDAAPSIVRQIGGEPKGDMLVMLGLTPRTAQVYRRGVEALKRPGFKFDDKQASDIFNTYAGGIPAELRTPVFNMARGIEAGWMEESGKSEPTADFADRFRRAMDYAVGRRGDGPGVTGGFVKWNNSAAWLPQDMAPVDFQNRIARASAGDWIRAAVDAQGNPTRAVPHHFGPGGKPVPYKVGDALRFPKGGLVTVAPGIFNLIDPSGGAVVDQNGRPWQFDVRRLPASHLDAQLAAHGYARR